MVSDLKRYHEKMSDSVSFPLLTLTLVIKLTNFDFAGHQNTLIFFDKKKIMSDLIMYC